MDPDAAPAVTSRLAGRPSLATARLGGRRHPLERRLESLPRRRLGIIGGVAAAAAVVVLGLLLAARESDLVNIDDTWMTEILENRAPWWDVPARLFDIVGGGVMAVAIVPAVVAIAFLLARRPWSALVFLVGSGVSAGIVQALKYGFGRVRPEDILIAIDSPSFPSGHTANAATLVLLLVFLVPRWWGAFFGAVYVVAMALSRTYLGAHWLTDTVGGAVLGAGVAIVAWAVFEPLLRRERGDGIAAPEPEADVSAGDEADRAPEPETHPAR